MAQITGKSIGFSQPVRKMRLFRRRARVCHEPFHSLVCSASVKCLRPEMTMKSIFPEGLRVGLVHHSFTKRSIFLYCIINHPNLVFIGVKKTQNKTKKIMRT